MYFKVVDSPVTFPFASCINYYNRKISINYWLTFSAVVGKKALSINNCKIVLPSLFGLEKIYYSSPPTLVAEGHASVDR